MTRATTSPRAARTTGLDQSPAAAGGPDFTPDSNMDLRKMADFHRLFRDHPSPVVRDFATLGLLAREELRRRGL